MTDLSQEYIEQLGATAVRLGRCWSVLGEVVALAQQAPGLTEDQLRARLVELADLAARQPGGETR